MTQTKDSSTQEVEDGNRTHTTFAGAVLTPNHRSVADLIRFGVMGFDVSCAEPKQRDFS